MFTQKRLIVQFCFLIMAVLLLLSGEVFATRQRVTVTLSPLTTPNFGAHLDNDTLWVINGDADSTIQVAFNHTKAGSPVAPLDSIRHVGSNAFTCEYYAASTSSPYSVSMGSENGCQKAPIPTLSEWAMIIFSLVLLGLMTYYVIRRRKLAHVTAN